MTEHNVFSKTHYKKPSVIINSAAGSVEDISCEMRTVFNDLNHTDPTIHLVEPNGLDRAFKTVKRDGTDLLVIYGGDGTCKSGAIVARQMDVPLIALPGGTMNMLPKALYGTDNWRIALTAALSQSEPRWQPAGDANGKIFFCGAIIGDPIVMSEAREFLRDGDVLKAVKKVPDILDAITHGEDFEFTVDRKIFDKQSNVVQIYCPYMTSGALYPDEFELASVPQLSMQELMGIGATAITQDWRQSAHVKTTRAKSIEIRGQGAFDVLLDGELDQISCPVDITLEREGVLVLAPRPHKRLHK